jgi:hypothetical protein
MEDAQPILEFLPESFGNKTEEQYIGFLWDSFASNYENEKYEFANLAFHLLYMSFVCFAVWKIRIARKPDFDKAMVGFQNDVENKLNNADSPFKFYDHLKEAAIFRFIKLIGCGNEQVGEFSRFVKQRNKIAHPSGTMFFNDQTALDEHIALILKEIGNIQSHMMPVVHEIFQAFLIESCDPETREWPDEKTEIEANLLHKHYLSKQDIAACMDFDITSLSDHGQFAAIKVLFETFTVEYKLDEA